MKVSIDGENREERGARGSGGIEGCHDRINQTLRTCWSSHTRWSGRELRLSMVEVWENQING